jgi:23S rRNA (cytosine1962-C5)-methyltransferase
VIPPIARSDLAERPAGTLHLHKGREKPVLNRHPWILSGAVAHVEADAKVAPGDLVDVVAAGGRWLAGAYYNPQSQIRARILTWDRQEPLDRHFWDSRLGEALDVRERIGLPAATDAYRLVSAEADRLPGLIVDRYGDYVVVQCLTAGIERRKDLLVSLLNERLAPRGIIERSDVAVREKEGLVPSAGLLAGELPPDDFEVREHGLAFQADLLRGHKTGLYLDQRENRRRVCRPAHVSGREVLNVFAYTGGFAVYAAAYGATAITNVEDVAPLLVAARANVARNAGHRPQDEYVSGDAFRILRQYRDSGRQFDMVILDPPKFAQSKGNVPAACRGYKDLNWLAMRILRPGGLLATFSCSGLVSADLFQKVLFGAAVDARREVRLIESYGQSADHPVLLTFPESAYLKGFLCAVY